MCNNILGMYIKNYDCDEQVVTNKEQRIKCGPNQGLLTNNR